MTKHLQLTDELQELAALYAAGAMPEGERREYARHLEEDGCEVCRAESVELQAAAHAMAISVPLASPSAGVKRRLMAQARSLEHRSEHRRHAWIPWLVAATSSVALIGMFVINSDLRRQVESLGTRVAELETQMGQQRTQLASLTAPEVRIVNLAGQGPTPEAGARIFWNEAVRRWSFYVRDLPQSAADRSYQLWFVPVSGNPVSAGVFNTSPDGSATLDIPVPQDLAALKAAAVTLEPAGGVPQPTGPFVLLGSLE